MALRKGIIGVIFAFDGCCILHLSKHYLVIFEIKRQRGVWCDCGFFSFEASTA
jgi:hypothetical protein